MMNFHITQSHLQLITACYPPSSTLTAAAPHYKPNPQELSRLTYYASNHPEKLSKLCQNLLKNVTSYARKAQMGNIRARASLLVTLAIFKSLLTECRRDISLLSPALISSVDVTLHTLPVDLEVVARAATLFAAWTSFTDGRIVGTDSTLTKRYISIIKQLASMCFTRATSEDHEEQNRTRLVGFVAVSSLVGSDVLFNSFTEFRSQISIIIPAMLFNVIHSPLSLLDDSIPKLKSNPTGFLSKVAEVNERPELEQQASTVYVHVDGDRGPSSRDVFNITIKSLSSLLNRSSGSQVDCIIRSALTYLFESDAVDDHHCHWIAQRMIEWTQYQYRYAVPTLFVEQLLDVTNTTSSQFDLVLTSMLVAILGSSTPIVNLSTSDILSNLLTILMRRVFSGSQQIILSKIIDCIVALKAHIYYVDQIHDLVCELLSRLVALEHSVYQNVISEEKESYRVRAIICILDALIGLTTPFANLDSEDNNSEGNSVEGDNNIAAKASIREKTGISVEAWLDSVPFLLDVDASVRNHYAHALILFLKHEILETPLAGNNRPLNNKTVDCDATMFTEDLYRNTSVVSVMAKYRSVTPFLQLLHITIYILSVSAVSLKLPITAFSNSNQHDDLVARAVDLPLRTCRQRQRSNAIPPTGKPSIARRLLESFPTIFLQKGTINISQVDYDNVLNVLATAHEQLPCSALLIGVPMILALKNVVQQCLNGDLNSRSQNEIILKKLLINIWLVIGSIWKCLTITDLAKKALLKMPQLFRSTDVCEKIVSAHGHQEVLYIDADVDGKGIDTDILTVSSETIVAALASNKKVQIETKLDEGALLKYFGSRWSVEGALDEQEGLLKTNYSHLNDYNPVLKISPSLMQGENLSLQSLTRSMRCVGINQLRDALDSRSGMSECGLEIRPVSLCALSAVSRERVLHSRDKHKRSSLKMFDGVNSEIQNILNELGVGTESETSEHYLVGPKMLHKGTSSFLPPYKY